MNFHSCQAAALPGERSLRDFVLTPRSPPPHPASPPLAAPPALCCLRGKARHQHFHFSASHKTRESVPATRERIDQSATGPCLLKRSLSIAARRLAIGTNEAHRSLIPIPFDLTHFIDSPCASNEMLNLSLAAAVPCGYCYGDREASAERWRNTTIWRVFN